MFSVVQWIELTASIAGLFSAFILTVIPRLLYKLSKGNRRLTQEGRGSLLNNLAFLFLGCIFGCFIGFIAGFIAGIYAGRSDPQMLYGPIIGAYYGVFGGIIGGLIGSSINTFYKTS